MLSACSSSGASATRATVSLVRSSSVGPRPPVVMTTSARSSASRRAFSSLCGLSPTVCTCKRSIPSAESSRATWVASVLTVCPSRSSVPTDIISAFMRPPFCLMHVLPAKTLNVPLSILVSQTARRKTDATRTKDFPQGLLDKAEYLGQSFLTNLLRNNLSTRVIQTAKETGDRNERKKETTF